MAAISTSTKRILSLDVFRGLTIVLMILVNSQGNQYAYPILEHASWDGCTLADIVFPFFLFIVGLTSVVSLKKSRELPCKSELYKRIFQRSMILFGLGIFLNVFPYFINLHTIRIYGILQRIAVCYLICSVLYLNTAIKTQILIFLGILLGYWFVMTVVPVPGFGADQLTMNASWVSYFDQLFFSSAHLLGKTYDPEGFFSTIPSIATTLSGVLAGSLLLSSLSNQKKCLILFLIGLAFLLSGWIWSYSFPINKNLWTSSFVLWSSGLALVIFAFCFLVIDILNYTKWALPLKIFGMNALFAFVFHVLLLKLQFAFYFPLSNGTSGNLKAKITDYLFWMFSNANAALAYSLIFLLLNFFVVSYLYKRKIFISI